MPENSHTLPEFRVRFSETDMSGAAHWSSILRWTENAESDFFRARGLDFATSENGVAKTFRRTNLQAEFLSQAHYDDRISVEIKLLSQDTSSFNWEFSIFAIDGDEKRLVARGTYTSICTESTL